MNLVINFKRIKWSFNSNDNNNNDNNNNNNNKIFMYGLFGHT